MNSLCQTCRKLLYRTDPCRGVGVACGRTDGGAKKSTAARMDVPGKTTVRDALAQIGTTPPVKAVQPPVSREAAFASTGDSVRKRVPAPNTAAGTQAPPVDTKLGRPRDTGPSQGKSKRAAQMREYQRQRRANKKAKEAK